MSVGEPDPAHPLRDDESLRRRLADLEAEVARAQTLERELARARAVVENLIQLSPLAIQVLDREGRHRQANDAFLKMWGAAPPPEWSVFADAQLSQILGEEAIDRLRAGELFRLEREVFYDPSLSTPPPPAGSRPRWTRTIVFAVRDDAGGPDFYVVAHEDITDRKEAERERHTTERRYQALLEKSSDLIGLLDAQRRVTYLSPSFETTLGWRREDFLETSLLSLVHPDDIAIVRGAYDEAIQRPAQPVHATHRMRGRDGKYRILECTVVSHLDAAHVHGVLINARDVTEQRQAQAEREAMERRVQQMQKLEALGVLAGGVAHDFNSILAIVHGFAEMTLALVEKDSPIAKHQRQVLTAVRRAKRVVEQILTFSRQMEDKRPLAKASLSRVVQEALNMLDAYLPPTIKVLRRLDPAPCVVPLDPTDIQQIVINLCTNAYDAMEKTGGALEASVERQWLEAGAAPPRGVQLPPGPYAVLTVRDTGAGMDEATMARAFEPFFTTKPIGRGTGMGLPIVHGMVRSRGGDITIDSRPGEGATVRVFLPMIENGAEPAEFEEELPPPTGRERILLVDDETQILGVYRLMLEKLGYSVTAFSSGVRALNAFLKNLDAFDLVVTDQLMPRLTGLALIRRVREHRPELPAVIVSAHERKTVYDELAGLRGVQFMRKPFSQAALARAVRRLLDERPARPTE